jgi:ABC-type glycerol-3-phosphate transport system permease component
MVSTSLKPLGKVFAFPPQWIPTPPQWHNYVDAFSSPTPYVEWDRWLGNSLFISAATIIGNILSNSLVAFGFARLKFPGRDVLFMVLVSTMMLPFAVTMIPLYLIFVRINWIDSFKPLIVPSFFGSAFFTFMARQFYLTIPMELDEAAKMDGASSLTIWWRIILPMSRPIIATIAIFTFIGTWNAFMWPLIVIDSPQNWTLQLGLMSFRQQFMQTHWNQMMAVSTLMTLPCLVLFFFAQRYFIQGLALTGIKG